jgi:hypothetical protein
MIVVWSLWRRAAMSDEQTKVTCEQCYFRRAGLCALPGNTPCPTFRPAQAMERPRDEDPIASLRRGHRVPAAA